MNKNKFYIFKDTNEKELKILRTRCEKVPLPLSKINKEIATTLKNYVEFGKSEEKRSQYKVLPSFGIAAPQIGSPIKMFYVSVPNSYNSLEILPNSKNVFAHLFINPIIVSHQNIYCAFKNGESCLSVSCDYNGIVKRPAIVKIKAFDLQENKEITFLAKGRLAIILQHEIDHLKGILYYDKIKTNISNDELQYLY